MIRCNAIGVVQKKKNRTNWSGKLNREVLRLVKDVKDQTVWDP